MTQKLTQFKSKNRGVGNTKCASTPPSRSRNWFFTLNNYNDNEIDTIYNEIFKTNLVTLVFQEEKGENGTPHLQGCTAYKNARSFDSMKKLLPRANWSKVKNLKNALAYCCKDETRNGKVWLYNYQRPKKWTDEELNKYMLNQFLTNCKDIDLETDL